MGKASNRKWFNRIMGASRAKLENLDPNKLQHQLAKFAKRFPDLIKKEQS